MQFKRLNIIIGWLIWVIATITYYRTVEPTMSFWDCGEFIASAYKLEVGHPPGAPLFMLIARLFAAFVQPEKVAIWVNTISVLASSFTILFLFWTVTHLALKLTGIRATEKLSKGAILAIIGSGAVGALAYTFSDSFWFSAVEGEVYAMSSLFTAVVFWAMLKWESEATANDLQNVPTADRHENRWIVLIAYLMGLSIGVHLLNLLAIPAICFIYYFKKYTPTRWGVVLTLAVSGGLLILIQEGVIVALVKMAGWFELRFVNGMNMPFNSGTIVYAALVIGLICFGLWYSRRKSWVVVNTLVLGIAVAIIGYSTFATVIIRSQADPPMDENNPDNLFALLAYLNREQYGDRPLFYGQYFNSPIQPDDPETDENESYRSGSNTWVKSFSVVNPGPSRDVLVLSCRKRFEAEEYLKAHPDDKLTIHSQYIESGEKKNSIPNYDPDYCGFFPRMYSSEGRHVAQYKSWSDYKGWNDPRVRTKVQDMERSLAEAEQKTAQYSYYLRSGQADPRIRSMVEDSVRIYSNMIPVLEKRLKPSYGEDFRYLVRYQAGWMYWRYFMWNFAGRQDDKQGHGGFMNGNWITGINWIDQEKLGNRENLPDSVTLNKGFNRYYFLPLILGLIGLIFQLVKHPKDFTVVSLLFLLTGLAIVIYLNQTPEQPRERDYAYSGSFYAFAIWIGLSVYALYHAAITITMKQFGILAGMCLGGSAIIYLLESALDNGHFFGYSLFFISLVVTALCALAALLKLARIPDPVKAVLFTLLCLAGPYVMAHDGWDDHSRALRRTGVDFAKNYLDSLEKNAIIFTNGDNDTFPLWYAQEVEGYRTDVRIVNLSLLNTDWYIDQMKRRAYDSPPVPIKMLEQKYRQGTRDIVILDHARNKKDIYLDLSFAMDVALDDSKTTLMGDGKEYPYIPSNKLRIPVDSTRIAEFLPFVGKGDSLVKAIEWTVIDEKGRPKPYILKNQFAVLDILKNNNWERPVYFAVTTGPDAYMGLEPYFQLEGLAYRLVPIHHEKSANPNQDGGIATDLMFKHIMDDFQWGNMDTEDVYMDENNRRMTTNLRLQFANLAEELINEDKNDMAIQVLDKCIAVMPEKNVPYDRVMLPLVESYYEAGDSIKARALADRLYAINKQEIDYYLSLDKEYQAQMVDDIDLKLRINGRMTQIAQRYFPGDSLLEQRMQEVESLFDRIYPAEPEDTLPGRKELPKLKF